MRKNLIAMSVATLVAGLGLAGGATAAVYADAGAGFATDATAELVSPGGIGHQLFVPYYNVQNGNATLFNIVNTDAVNGKAVKVRFRGASNSDDVFDFQLYLSPGDVWAANISRGADGRAVLTTPDRSCTLPANVGAGAGNAFVTARLPQTFTADNLASQTREGYIEAFNMADIPPLRADGTANPLFDAIKHVAGVPPCNGGGTSAQQTAAATAISNLQNDPGTLAAAQALGFRSPSTGLFANFTIINVPKSGAASGEAVSITATVPNANAIPVPGRGNIVFFPQTGASAGNVDTFTADPALRTLAGTALGVTIGDAGNTAYAGTLPVVAAAFFDLPDMSTPYLAGAITTASPLAQAEALSRSLATVNVINEYIGDPVITANTDWVFSMPTRRYSVALDYRPLSASPAAAAARVFSRFPNRDYFMAANTAVVNTQICTTTAGVTFYNREEGTAVGTSFVISPNPPAAAFRLCGEDSVLTFNATAGASVLGAEVAVTNFNTGVFKDGWANVGTPGVATGTNAALPAGFDPAGNGLPIVGKAFVRASNPAVSAGIAANFGASWEHRYVRPVNP
jgi:hypothetical protein